MVLESIVTKFGLDRQPNYRSLKRWSHAESLCIVSAMYFDQLMDENVWAKIQTDPSWFKTLTERCRDVLRPHADRAEELGHVSLSNFPAEIYSFWRMSVRNPGAGKLR